VAGKVQGKDHPPGVDGAQLGPRWTPDAAIEGQAVQKNERRPIIEIAVEVAGQTCEPPDDRLLVVSSLLTCGHLAPPVNGVSLRRRNSAAYDS
jgi:hypothetical protein